MTNQTAHSSSSRALIVWQPSEQKKLRLIHVIPFVIMATSGFCAYRGLPQLLSATAFNLQQPVLRQSQTPLPIEPQLPQKVSPDVVSQSLQEKTLAPAPINNVPGQLVALAAPLAMAKPIIVPRPAPFSRSLHPRRPAPIQPLFGQGRKFRFNPFHRFLGLLPIRTGRFSFHFSRR